ncbi:hypothetical protein H9P43_007748 [Blastocladiella emersonii ATCC 22665]|nr:hypothetical protein H9P43_007748 [Blastocladiella emersonii ATCC 22665]
MERMTQFGWTTSLQWFPNHGLRLKYHPGIGTRAFDRGQIAVAKWWYNRWLDDCFFTPPDFERKYTTMAMERMTEGPFGSGYSHLEQDGKESGDVEGVDGQDDAAPASKRSRTSDSSSRRLSDSEFLMGIKEVFQSVATADSKPVLTAALEWVQDAYNDNEEYQIDVATRLTEDQALRVMAVSESKRKRILEIFIQ